MAEGSKEKLLQTLVWSTQAKMSAAQLCQQATFGSASSQALDVLADVLSHRETHAVTKEIARRAKANAENCNRAECNLQDTLAAVQVLGAGSALLKDHLAAQRSAGFPFVLGPPYTDQVPIYRKVPWQRKPRDAEDDKNSFFPPDPPAHTFLYTPVEVGRPKESGNEKAELAKEKRALEDRLATLLSQKADQDGDAVMRDAGQNPFLAPVTPAARQFLDEL